MRERFGAKDPRAQMLRFHAQTAGSTLTAQQPLNNVVRTSIEALAAVLGGAQSLHTNGYDEALALPTEASARVALRTQQILADETGIANVVDPVGGAYAVEALTSEIEARATALIAEIDRRGGMLAAIEAGFPQREIERRAVEHQRAVEAGERVVVGVNRYDDTAHAAPPPLHRLDPALEAAQIARLDGVRTKRDESKTRAALEALAQAARGTDNLVPPILAAVKTRATLGEIADVLRNIFGEYRSGDRCSRARCILDCTARAVELPLLAVQVAASVGRKPARNTGLRVDDDDEVGSHRRVVRNAEAARRGARSFSFTSFSTRWKRLSSAASGSRFGASAASSCGTIAATTGATRARAARSSVRPKRLPFFKVGKELKERVNEGRSTAPRAAAKRAPVADEGGPDGGAA